MCPRHAIKACGDWVVCHFRSHPAHHPVLTWSSHAVGGPQEAVICMPMDRRLPRVRLRTRRGAALLGARFLVRLDGWPPSSHYPAAHLVRVLGGLGDLQ